ncbi:MAG: Rdx family protein [Campylobacteraceae bacterium]|nr:Rdx family protein [Campylobacteraceae bacterium]
MPRASRAEEEIKNAFSDAVVTLVVGKKGAFDVSCDGKLIFSKLLKVGAFIERFPDQGELVKLLKQNGYK